MMRCAQLGAEAVERHRWRVMFADAAERIMREPDLRRGLEWIAANEGLCISAVVERAVRQTIDQGMTDTVVNPVHPWEGV